MIEPDICSLVYVRDYVRVVPGHLMGSVSLKVDVWRWFEDLRLCRRPTRPRRVRGRFWPVGAAHYITRCKCAD